MLGARLWNGLEVKTHLEPHRSTHLTMPTCNFILIVLKQKTREILTKFEAKPDIMLLIVSLQISI